MSLFISAGERRPRDTNNGTGDDRPNQRARPNTGNRRGGENEGDGNRQGGEGGVPTVEWEQQISVLPKEDMGGFELFQVFEWPNLPPRYPSTGTRIVFRYQGELWFAKYEAMTVLQSFKLHTVNVFNFTTGYMRSLVKNIEIRVPGTDDYDGLREAVLSHIATDSNLYKNALGLKNSEIFLNSGIFITKEFDDNDTQLYEGKNISSFEIPWYDYTSYKSKPYKIKEIMFNYTKVGIPADKHLDFMKFTVENLKQMLKIDNEDYNYFVENYGKPPRYGIPPPNFVSDGLLTYGIMLLRNFTYLGFFVYQKESLFFVSSRYFEHGIPNSLYVTKTQMINITMRDLNEDDFYFFNKDHLNPARSCTVQGLFT